MSGAQGATPPVTSAGTIFIVGTDGLAGSTACAATLWAPPAAIEFDRDGPNKIVKAAPDTAPAMKNAQFLLRFGIASLLSRFEAPGSHRLSPRRFAAGSVPSRKIVDLFADGSARASDRRCLVGQLSSMGVQVTAALNNAARTTETE